MSTRVRAARPGAPAWLLVLIAAVPLCFLAVFFLLPVGGMLHRGFFADGALDLSGFTETLARARIRRLVWLTIAQSGLASAISVVLGVPVAYCLYRLSFPGQAVLRAIVTMPFVLPTIVVGVAFRTLLSEAGPLGFLGLDGTWTAIILGLVFFNISVVARTVGVAWQGLGSRAEESASSLGAAPLTVFRTITLPALRPAILSAASVVFLFCATSFGVVLTLGGLRYGTIETEIYLQTAHFLDLKTAAVLSVVQLVVVLALLAVIERARRTTTTRASTGRSSRRRPAAAEWPVLGVTAGVVLFLLAPIASLVGRSLQKDGAWTLANYAALGTTGAGNALLVTVWQALQVSLVIAANATVIAVLLGVLVAFVVSRATQTRTGRRWVSAFDAAFMLPLGVSAVTVGFGFFITLNHPPLDLRTSSVLVPIAQATVALPLVVRTITPALTQIDDRARQAAMVLGASYGRALLTVDLPVVWRPLLAAAGFAAAVSMGEFGATSFLARADNPTLPVVIYRLISRPDAENFGMAMAASVVLALVTVALMGLVDRLGVGAVGTF
ncbi:ABC transporter permease [Cumulibacter manganitolerans]|uniref:ABC transporter permease n=1 Tax=Cumulibacter manganitolerans TaxID=1884992 RepID=UPI0012975C96|nr:iron ABC transporter permease [Cumulibacter manganitolerans]